MDLNLQRLFHFEFAILHVVTLKLRKRIRVLFLFLFYHPIIFWCLSTIFRISHLISLVFARRRRCSSWFPSPFTRFWVPTNHLEPRGPGKGPPLPKPQARRVVASEPTVTEANFMEGFSGCCLGRWPIAIKNWGFSIMGQQMGCGANDSEVHMIFNTLHHH